MKIIGIGDVVNGHVVTEITKNGVRLEGPDGRWTLVSREAIERSIEHLKESRREQ